MAKEKRFWRGKLPTVVWDARNDRPLCDFTEGHITTSDEYTIKVLKKIGYIEIPLNAVRPPDVIEPIQLEGTPDVKSLPRGLTEKGAIQIEEGRSKKPLSESEDFDGPAVAAPKKPKNSPDKKVGKAKKRDLKRRKSK